MFRRNNINLDKPLDRVKLIHVLARYYLEEAKKAEDRSETLQYCRVLLDMARHELKRYKS